MLTKEHLKFRVRSRRVSPQFTKFDDQDLETAAGLCQLFLEGVGKPIEQVEQMIRAARWGDRALVPGLSKLMFGVSESEEPSREVEEFRWRCFEAAEIFRKEASSLKEFRGKLIESLGLTTFGEVRNKIYQDLPYRRKLVHVPKLEASELLNRYNCALVQGLLIHSTETSIRISESSPAELRGILRSMKFHRLLAELTAEQGNVEMRLGGPLSLEGPKTAYGLRLANFFPNILHCKKWLLTAQVEVKGKSGELKLDPSCPIKPLRGSKEAFIPPEFRTLLDEFPESATGWTLKEGDALVNLHGVYIVPDFLASPKNGKHDVLVELFHDWHGSQFLSRVKMAEERNLLNLKLGVSRGLVKKKKLKNFLDNSSWFQKNGFLFGEFPTPRNLLSVLD